MNNTISGFDVHTSSINAAILGSDSNSAEVLILPANLMGVRRLMRRLAI